MSITGNHFGKKFIDLEERLNSPPGSTLKYHEFELVPRIKDNYQYGIRPNPNFNTLYNPSMKMNNYQTEEQASINIDEVDNAYQSNDNLLNNDLTDDNMNPIIKNESNQGLFYNYQVGVNNSSVHFEDRLPNIPGSMKKKKILKKKGRFGGLKSLGAYGKV